MSSSSSDDASVFTSSSQAGPPPTQVSPPPTQKRATTGPARKAKRPKLTSWDAILAAQDAYESGRERRAEAHFYDVARPIRIQFGIECQKDDPDLTKLLRMGAAQTAPEDMFADIVKVAGPDAVVTGFHSLHGLPTWTPEATFVVPRCPDGHFISTAEVESWCASTGRAFECLRKVASTGRDTGPVSRNYLLVMFGAKP